MIINGWSGGTPISGNLHMDVAWHIISMLSQSTWSLLALLNLIDGHGVHLKQGEAEWVPHWGCRTEVDKMLRNYGEFTSICWDMGPITMFHYREIFPARPSRGVNSQLLGWTNSNQNWKIEFWRPEIHGLVVPSCQLAVCYGKSPLRTGKSTN